MLFESENTEMYFFYIVFAELERLHQESMKKIRQEYEDVMEDIVEKLAKIWGSVMGDAGRGGVVFGFFLGAFSFFIR